MQASDLSRRSGWTILAGLLLHAGLLCVAAWLYPGGTHWDRSRTGFDPVRNFWCDLMGTESLGGAPNGPSDLLTRAALVTLSLILPFFWRRLGRHLAVGEATGRTLRFSGDLGSMGLFAVALTTGWLKIVHDLALVLLGPPGLLANIMGAYLSLRLGSWGVRVAAALSACFSSWNMVQYAREAVLDSPGWPGLPLVQRLATGAVLSWMVLVVFATMRRGEDHQP